MGGSTTVNGFYGAAGGGAFVGRYCAQSSNTPVTWYLASNGTVGGDWADVFLNISPYAFAYAGAALALGFSTLGAAWGIFITGTSLIGGAVKAPRIKSKNLVSVIFCEATAIFGVITAILLLGKLTGTGNSLIKEKCAVLFSSGYAIFWAGFSVGFTNLFAGISVGITGRACALADAANPRLFVATLVTTIFASALAIFGLIVGIIQSGNAQFPTT
jgi:V-type H+-transporting ATPase proteolipid subunit